MELTDRDVPTVLGRIRVRVGGEGPAMLFWPSLLMDGSLWAAQAGHFGTGRRVVLVDPPGHGASEPLTRGFSFDECARCVVDILDGLDLTAADFVGNSWGGMIGGTFAARHPERVRTAVLMNCTASPAGLRQRLEYPLLTRVAKLLGGIRPPLTRSVVTAFTGPTTRREKPDVVAAIKASAERADPRSASWAVTSVVPRRPDQRALFGGIRTPVLVVAGEEDATFPVAETRAMAEAIPGARFEVLPRTAHLAALESPAEVNALIEDFLAARR
ncbi:alpha/beta hydrolase [Amycolatopsis minnesotensis]